MVSSRVTAAGMARLLVQAERDFAEHLDKLRRARDREEFERFMNERRAQSQGPNDPAAQI